MAYTLQIQIKEINDSLQIGDTVYYIPVSALGDNNSPFLQNANIDDIVKVGECSAISKNLGYIKVDGDLNITPPSKGDYIFFSKDNSINLAAVKGYYAEVKLKNNDNQNYAELFQVSVGVEQSSK